MSDCLPACLSVYLDVWLTTYHWLRQPAVKGTHPALGPSPPTSPPSTSFSSDNSSSGGPPPPLVRRRRNGDASDTQPRWSMPPFPSGRPATLVGVVAELWPPPLPPRAMPLASRLRRDGEELLRWAALVGVLNGLPVPDELMQSRHTGDSGSPDSASGGGSEGGGRSGRDTPRAVEAGGWVMEERLPGAWSRAIALDVLVLVWSAPGATKDGEGRKAGCLPQTI